MISIKKEQKSQMKSADIIMFPKAVRGRPPVKARRMAMVLLTNPGMTQVAAAQIAGINQPYTNAHKIVRSQGFLSAYSDYQAHLNRELPFDLEQAHCMYIRAYNIAVNSTEMIKAIDGLCKLHGLSDAKKNEVKVSSVYADDKEVKAIILAEELKCSPEYYV